MNSVAKYFRFGELGTNFRTELIAGLTTFVSMAYILFVNPTVLGAAGMDKGAVFTATGVAAAIATIFMGLVARYPIAIAPGLGVNAFFAYSVVIGMKVPWQTAMAGVLIAAIIFLLLTFFKIRETIINMIPQDLKVAIAAGIGLFIAFIGLKLSGLMAISISLSPNSLGQVVQTHGNLVPPASEALLTLGNLHSGETLLALFSLIFTALLMARKIQGSLLIGVAATTILSYATGLSTMPENFTVLAVPDFSKAAFLQLDIPGALHMGLITIIFSFTFVELFDSMGTLIGTATEAKIADPKSGKFPGLGKAMTVDAIGVSAGALLGTSTITAFVESAAGVGAGGRTGLTAVTTGVLFLICLFLAPIVSLVPNAATSPVLIIVGALMLGAIRNIDFDDWTEGFPAYLVIVLMPFTYSIANGISAGLVAYPLLKIISGRAKEVNWIMYVLAVLVIIRYVFF